MVDEHPNKASETSPVDHRTLVDLYQEIRDVYQRYPQPLVVGFSGGKDSTAVLQLVWKALQELPADQRNKPVFVVASDTGVENPIIIKLITATLHQVEEAARRQGMPLRARPVLPTLNDSFWVNLIGRGYPAPTTHFRWCTERLKIRPIDRFIRKQVAEHGEVIMVLGLRKSESATRAQLMNTYQVSGHFLRRHVSLPGAYVYAPIAHFSAQDVWEYLRDSAPPWGGSHADLEALYNRAHAAERPMVIDSSTPPTGASRFGCWVCTVAQRDASMEALIASGEEWMRPLWEFRQWLHNTTRPERKLDFRDIKGRDGRVILKKNGKPAARTYKFEVSKEMLAMVLRAQLSVRRRGPDPNLTLITEDELHEIRRIWRTERQDWHDSVPDIFRRVNRYDLDWPVDDDQPFNGEHESLLSSICREHGVPFQLVAKLLEAERQNSGFARRARIHKTISSVLGEEWRSEEEILAEPAQLRLV